MSAIYKIIPEKGYTGSNSNLRRYCSKIKKMFNNTGEQKIEKRNITIKRSVLLKALYKPFKSILELDKQMIEKINEKYPFYMKIIELVNNFKFIIKSKDLKKFEDWIIEAKTLNNSYVNSFINGINRDVEAVKNSVKYNYNNGLAEGSVNKLKVIKRIMYGRNSFETLKKKVLYVESVRKEGVNNFVL